MATDIVMPNLGFDSQSGILIEWYKQPGDAVARGEAIALVESDKANVELESIAAGVMLARLVEAGTDVAVGTVIAQVGQPAELKAKPVANDIHVEPVITPARKEASPVAKRLAAERNLALADIPGSGPRGRISREDVEAYLASGATPDPTPPANGRALRALPKVRKAAREMAIDLAVVPPTGSRGEITLQDLDAYQPPKTAMPVREPATVVPPAAAALPDGAREIPLSRGRQVIGQRLSQSMREAPHFYVTGEFDLEAALARLASLPQPRPRINDLIQYLVVQALRHVPELNATFVDGHLYQYDSVHLAMAVAVDGGLLTPVIPKADRYSLTGLAAESAELVQRARDNRLSPESLQGGSFTISNLGVIRQVDRFTAVINPPQVAIVAVGTVKPRPIVVDGGLFAHHTVHLTISGDHRVVDGMHLGRFLAAFQQELEAFAPK